MPLAGSSAVTLAKSPSTATPASRADARGRPCGDCLECQPRRDAASSDQGGIVRGPVLDAALRPEHETDSRPHPFSLVVSQRGSHESRSLDLSGRRTRAPTPLTAAGLSPQAGRVTGDVATMKPWEPLGQTCTPDGSDMRLTVRDGEYVILVNGKTLMSSRTHGSEEALATLACRHVGTSERPRVLVGGLGMGFTLRATIGLAPRRTRS